MIQTTFNHRPFVFIDIETTGGSARQSRITEIGALRVENGEITRRFSQLLDPEQPIPYFITKLTGITNRMVAHQPTFADIADELEDMFDGAILWPTRCNLIMVLSSRNSHARAGHLTWTACVQFGSTEGYILIRPVTDWIKLLNGWASQSPTAIAPMTTPKCSGNCSVMSTKKIVGSCSAVCRSY